MAKTDKEVANEKATRIMSAVARMAAFYRNNPHRFAKDYLNINLKLFQKMLIYEMNFSSNLMFIAARGLGKSFLIAVFACIRCILYPGTIIVVSSKTRKQAIGILEKITDILMPNSANLRMEIKETVVNQSNAEIVFKNGSIIRVATANDNSRFMRAHILIYDEFRMIDLNVISTVLRKFLSTPRQPGFLDKPEYKDYPLERNKEFYLSSAWMVAHWSYDRMLSYTNNFLDESKAYFVCGLPYQLSIKEKLLDPRQVEDEMSESDFNQFTFDMEMSCLWQGSADGALYRYDDVSKNRKLTKVWYPKKISDLLQDKKIKIPDKVNGEVRILSVDIALMSSKKRDNDASSIFVTQSIPNRSERYMSNVVYSENIEGVVTDELVLKIRKYFNEFEADYLVIDGRGLGLPVIDALGKDIYDDETGEIMPALACFNNPELAERCRVKGAPRVIYAVIATSELNSAMALGLREAFRQGKIHLPIHELDCEDEVLKDLKGYKGLDYTSKALLQMPYYNTTLLINELINLTYEPKGNIIRVHEKSGFRKDRYSSLSYNYYLISQLELKLKKPEEEDSEIEFIFKRPNPRGRDYGRRSRI